MVSVLGFLLVTGLAAACGANKLQTITLPTTEGLLAHWSCDESDGAVLHDSSGNGYDGAITGGTFTAGRFGNALALERGQYVTVSEFPQASPSWSVAAWISMDLGYGDVSLLTTDLPSEGGWALNINDISTRASFRYYDGTARSADGYEGFACPCLVTDHRWVHLVAVVDGDAQTLTFYADGRMRSPETPIYDVGLIHPGLPDLMIGHWTSSDPRYYAGLIDDIAIYSRALDPNDVLLLHSAAVPDLRK
jgi:hypothetical protein